MVEHGQLLRDLDQRQHAAVTSDAGLLCVLAGAGSGKTRVLTRRVAYRCATGAIDPRHVLVLTFTRKAAGELRSRLAALGLHEGVAAGTFHAVAYGQLRARWADRGTRAPELLERRLGLVARVLGGLERPELFDAMAEIDWARSSLIEPERYPEAAARAGRTPPVDAHRLATAMHDYAAEKKRRRLVDFDDLLALATRDLLADADYAEAQRWRHRHLFVDEFQDVNPLQYRLLQTWRGDRPDLCVVGDPEQAIYAWNGADASYLRDFTRHHRGADLVELVDNYRSSPQILGVARRLLARTRRGAPELRANQADGPAPTVVEHDTDKAEAQAIARAVRDAHAPGTSWSRAAVLVRTNAQTAALEAAFRAASIPYRVRGGTGFLNNPVVAAELRRLARSTRPLRDELADLVDREPTEAGRGEVADAAEHHAALVRLGRDHLAVAPDATGADFVMWAESTVGHEQVDTAADAVDVVTFHGAKGLEWPIVHLAGVEQGLVPIGHAESPAELAEERRLFYVAITRAQHELTFHWAAQRTFGERTVNRSPSMYLDAVSPTAEKPARKGVPKKITRQRDALAEATPAIDVDDPLFVALREWRSGAAKAANVPAYVVFHDTTLAAVANAKPTTERELLALPGIGQVKATRYGETLLRLVADHLEPAKG